MEEVYGRDGDSDIEQDQGIWGSLAENHDPDRVHNRATDMARMGDFPQAYKVVLSGLQVFPYSVDLLADAVMYSCGGEGMKHIERLNSLEYDCWNWRAFTFAIDYLIDITLPWTNDGDTRKRTIERALSLSERFIELFPRDERAYGRKIKALRARNEEGDKEKIERIFESLIMKDGAPESEGLDCFPVAQCCADYCEVLLERGEYEKVIKAASVGLASTAQEQPSADIGYFLYARALARDSVLHWNHRFSDEDKVFDSSLEQVRMALRDYNLAYEMDSFNRFRATIMSRSRILMELSSIPESEFPRFAARPEAGDGASGGGYDDIARRVIQDMIMGNETDDARMRVH